MTIMAEQDVTLELLLNKATSPALYDDDWDAIAAFCDQINKELEGPQFAVRLLAHKIQSPTEREALSALSTVEACVKNCGRTFHKEIGKFRFLNELIKILSPKYLGNRTTERVKKRSIELLYSWHKGLPHETKIGDAYKMLKEQKIIKEDPTYMDKTFDPFPPPKPRRADFEDEERAKELSRLLSSKKASDLQAANKLIKSMVKEDAEKSEKRSRRINELETINRQVKLLTEMVNSYKSSSSKADVDMMKELYEELEKQRPKMFRLASEIEEKDTDSINEILKVNDAVTMAMSQYMTRVQGMVDANGETEGAGKDTSLLDIGFDSSAQQAQSSSEPASGASAILQSDFHNLVFFFQQQQQAVKMSLAQAAMGAPGAAGLAVQPMLPGAGVPMAPVGQIRPAVFPMSSAAFPAQQQQANMQRLQASVFSSASAATALASSPAAAAGSSAMPDLDALGQSLLERNRPKDSVPPQFGPPPKLSMNQLAAARTAAPPPAPPLQQQHQQPQPQSVSLLDSMMTQSPVLTPISSAAQNSVSGSWQKTDSSSQFSVIGKADDSVGFSDMVSAPLPVPPPTQELLPLTDVFVQLENIKPAEDLTPLTAYDKNSVKSMLHFSTNHPRSDVLVMVLSTLSTNSKPVKNFMFQAAVPKVMKVKLQPPSATELPAYNPILPPTAITQVLLIANPRKEKVRLKFKISYMLGDESVTDVGDAENFPVQ